MTREEEIKARHKNGYWIMERQFKVPDGFDGGVCRVIDKDQKDKDFEWLLARNEELQRQVTGHKFISEQRANDVEKLKRRVEKMQAVVDAATWLMECYSVEAFDKNDAVIEIMESTDKAFVDLTSAINAKEQDDD